MKANKFKFLVLILILQSIYLFADIRPVEIKAKTINPGNKTSVRMESEKVIIDLYNDSSVVNCSFIMKNLGEYENLKIGFPEMNFYYYRVIKESEKLNRFKVKENGKALKFHLSDSLKNNAEFRRKIDSYQIIEEWYLWDGEFQKGETKTIEVQYSLPFGALYKSNKRYFTYLLSTGANWEGTIGKAEIIVNLKDIEADSIISFVPANCSFSNNQLSWTFLDFEPTTEHDIKVFYNSNKNLYTGKKHTPPVFIIDGNIKEDFDVESITGDDIASINILKNSEQTRKYTTHGNGVVIIHTKNFVLSKLGRIIKAKSKQKISLSDYDKLKEEYCLYVNGDKVDIAEIIDIKEKTIAKIKIKTVEDEKTQIMIELKK